MFVVSVCAWVECVWRASGVVVLPVCGLCACVRGCSVRARMRVGEGLEGKGVRGLVGG